jgi:hypothetical protein
VPDSPRVWKPELGAWTSTKRVCFLVGRVLNVADAVRSRNSNGEGSIFSEFVGLPCFVNGDISDHEKTLLRAQAIRSLKWHIRIFAEIVNPGNKMRASCRVVSNHLVCLRELVSSVLVRSVEVPGISTFMSPLMTSCSRVILRAA